MSIGQEIDKGFARIETAKKRSSVVKEKVRQNESNMIKIIWKTCDQLLALAGEPWDISVKLGKKIEIAGYELSCNNNPDCKWLTLKRLSDGKNATFFPYLREGMECNYDYYSFGYGDSDFRDEIYITFPQIINEMISAYAEIAEEEADIVEAKEEVGLRP